MPTPDLPTTMRAVRFHEFGEPGDVLNLEQAATPSPPPGRILVAVEACGLNPADWALCRGLFPGSLPRGVGCDIAGVVTALGDGVSDVVVGDRVFGTADWADSASAGAADYALADNWFVVPDGLNLTQAAAIPMALDTADVHLRALGLAAGQSILVHGAGGSVGFTAVQVAMARGATVIATAGATYAQQLRDLGAIVTDYGPDMVQRVKALYDKRIDFALDTAPVGGSLPDLIELVDGDPRRVLTISDFEEAERLGVRLTFSEDPAMLEHRYEIFPEFARRAAQGAFSVPIARTFPLENWREAMEVSTTGHARGKLVLLP